MEMGLKARIESLSGNNTRIAVRILNIRDNLPAQCSAKEFKILAVIENDQFFLVSIGRAQKCILSVVRARSSGLLPQLSISNSVLIRS